MEFKMLTPMETAIPKELAFNFDELKAEITERLGYYNSLVITEDAIKEGKADRAKLNKLRDAIDTRRKEIKKQCLAPYNDFEAKVKELLALIDAPIKAIDSQLKEYEEMRKIEKQEAIETMYEECVPEDLQTIIPIDRIFDQKWLNSSVTMKKVIDDLTTILERTRADLLALDAVEPEYAAGVRAEYIKTLDLGAALRHRKALQEAAEAFKRQQASQEEAPVENPAQTPCEPARETLDPLEEITEKVYVLRLELQVTKNQAAALKQFLTTNGISHRKI